MNATMYREAGAHPVYIITRNTREWNYNIRKYCRPVHASESAVFFGLSQWRRLKLATTAKDSVELLDLSAKTQEKDSY